MNYWSVQYIQANIRHLVTNKIWYIFLNYTQSIQFYSALYLMSDHHTVDHTDFSNTQKQPSLTWMMSHILDIPPDNLDDRSLPLNIRWTTPPFPRETTAMRHLCLWFTLFGYALKCLELFNMKCITLPELPQLQRVSS